ncbi:unnamed protein product [Boreogadus saida]
MALIPQPPKSQRRKSNSIPDVGFLRVRMSALPFFLTLLPPGTFPHSPSSPNPRPQCRYGSRTPLDLAESLTHLYQY